LFVCVNRYIYIRLPCCLSAEDEVGQLSSGTISTKSAKREHVESREDVVDGRMEDWRAVTQHGQTMPRNTRSNDSRQSPLESYSSNGVRGPGADSNSEYLQTETNSTSERSIYDREPEHCYQNVQKDETGRLLNRDTTAFCAALADHSIDRSVRSNSGEDISSSRNAPVSVANDRRNHAADGPSSVMQRNSRSVDNIFSDDVSGVRVETGVTLTNTKSAAGGGFTEQLPYHTGRSTFYQRVDSGEGILMTVLICLLGSCRVI
jgi:hypothetical protein